MRFLGVEGRGAGAGRQPETSLDPGSLPRPFPPQAVCFPQMPSSPLAAKPWDFWLEKYQRAVERGRAAGVACLLVVCFHHSYPPTGDNFKVRGERDKGLGPCCRMEFMVNCLLARVVALTGPGAARLRWGDGGGTLEELCTEGGFTGTPAQTFPVLSRVSPGFRRGGSSLRPCGHVTSGAMLPSRLDDLVCGEQSSICGEPTFTAILFIQRGNCLNPQERERDREKLPWKALGDQLA